MRTLTAIDSTTRDMVEELGEDTAWSYALHHWTEFIVGWMAACGVYTKPLSIS